MKHDDETAVCRLGLRETLLIEMLSLKKIGVNPL